MQHFTHAHEFPRHSGELTAGWLTRVLRARGALTRARVVRMQLSPLGSGGEDGQTLRVVPEYDADEPGAPRSLVLKLTPRRTRARLLRESQGEVVRELRFHAELAASVPGLTPACIHAELESETGCYALLLEEACGVEGMPDLRSVERALHALARLHAAHWNRPTTLPWASDDGARVARTQRLVRGAVEQLEARMGDELPETVARAARLYCEQLPAIGDVEVGAPQTVLHGDPTPRHWVMGRDGASLVDWQAMGVGSPGRDVARLLSSALPAVLRISQERRLLAIYCAALRCFGVEDYSVKECLADYRRGLLEAAARTVLSAARAQERVGQSAREVEGGAANQLARMELALVQNEVLCRRADARPGAGPRGPSSRPAKPAVAPRPAGSSLRSSCCAA